MLEDKDRIFQNLYTDFGPDLASALQRGDWKNTRNILKIGNTHTRTPLTLKK